MPRSIFFTLWLIVLIPLVLPGAEEGLSLQQFIDRAVRGSQTIQIAQESVAGAEQKIVESKSLYYPQVSLSASYSRLSLVSEFSMPINGQMMTFKFMSPNNYNLRLSATEMVFNWGRTGRMVKMGEAGVNLAEDAMAMLRQVTAYQVVPIYFNLLFIDEALGVFEETDRLFGERLKTLQARYDAGLASDFDLSLIRVQMSAIASQTCDLRLSRRKLELAYNRIAGRDLDEILQPAEKLQFQPLPLEESGLLAEALANRVELSQIRDQESLAKNQVALAKTGDKPSLVAAFTYELRNGFLPNVDQIRGNWTAALSASYPMFDGRRTHSQVAQAQIGLNALQRQRRDLDAGIAAEIRQATSEIKSHEEKIAIERVKLTHAEGALRIAEERHRKGLLSTTDLIDAQTALDNTRLGILQLTVNHALSRYSLYRALGRKIYQE